MDDAGLDARVDAVQWLDALWLACHRAPLQVGAAALGASPADDPTHPGSWPSGTPAHGGRATGGQDAAPSNAASNAEEPPATPAPDRPGRGGLFAAGDAGSAAARSASTTRVGGVSALNDRGAIARALRPLGKRLRSGPRHALNEAATVEAFAQTGILVPVMVPERESIFDARLLVEEAPAMPLWQSAIDEFDALLSRQVGFRSYRRLRLVIDNGDPCVVGGDAVRHTFDGVIAGNAPLLLIVTDGTSDAWHDTRMAKIVAQLGKRALVAAVQLMPERLWPQTALGPADVKAHALRPASTNHELALARPRWLDALSIAAWTPLPMVALRPAGLGRLAHLAMGRAGARVGAATLWLDAPATQPASDAAVLTAHERIAHFKTIASARVLQLAIQLAAAAPLTMPVIRLVHRVMQPDAPADDLPLLVLGGLLERRVGPLVGGDVQYEFAPGVREALQTSLLRSDVVVVQDAVAHFLTDRSHGEHDFTALIDDPEGTFDLPDWAAPFAAVTRQVAQLFAAGGRVAPTPARVFDSVWPDALAGASWQSLESGQPEPIGAHWDGDGINVAVFSAHASRVELCLFDDAGIVELARVALPGRTGDIWHGRIAGARPGLVYGLRAHGPWQPDQGHRFNPNKILLDPWAREIVRPPGSAERQMPRDDDPQTVDAEDNGRTGLKARVVHDAFDWRGDRRLRTPLPDTVIYEVHVRGFSKRLPGIQAAQRGTYAGLASEAAIAHLLRLGVTAVSLLPVQYIFDAPRLLDMGMVDYWGYNTLGFFCPDPRYASTGAPRDEFRRMVQRLHEAGIEVLLDVVFNHTPEGNEHGPTLSWRGLDNRSWYRLDDADPAHYTDWTGCGNTLNVRHPNVLQMVMDSLRYWVQEMHVDGFRFDLAPVLGRGNSEFERDGVFFTTVLRDPALRGIKLIAEPWDLGAGGYQAGGFPSGWLEWNDRFRDAVRAFWLVGNCTPGEFALRLVGSSDIYQARRRLPLDSVNFVTSHDGFTLTDLVSHDTKHNEANGEDNRDGHNHNLSWNCGSEGPCTDPQVNALRMRLKRALLATALLAGGTPMLAAGDELGHTQHGNNNAYCQDNAISWIDWDTADQTLIDFSAHVLALRRRLLPFGMRWPTGLPGADGIADMVWLRSSGEPMPEDHWNDLTSRVLGVLVNEPGRGGSPLLLLFNANDIDTDFTLPAGNWTMELDSSAVDGRGNWHRDGADVITVRSRSLVLLVTE